jgi:hypothetical protein
LSENNKQSISLIEELKVKHEAELVQKNEQLRRVEESTLTTGDNNRELEVLKNELKTHTDIKKVSLCVFFESFG